MNIVTLNTVNEVAPIYTAELKYLKASLMWSKEDSLDLTLLYKTKKGSYGVVSSEETGELDSFPFIAHDGGGVEEEDPSISYETLYLKDLSSFDEVSFIITNFSKLNMKKKINFNSYKSILKLSAKYGDVDKESRFILNLNSEVEGDYLVLGKVTIQEGQFLLKNINEVMSSKAFEENVPGSEYIVL